MRPGRTFVATALALLMIGCGSSPERSDVPARPATDAPKTPAPVAIAPATPTVDALTIAAESYAAGEAPLALQEGIDDPSVRYFDVIDCGEEGRSAEPNDAAPRHEEVVVRRVALLRRSLLRVGYGPAVIDAPLADYATQARRRADPDFDLNGYAGLAAALDAQRVRLQPQLPPIRAEGGCGAAETPIILKTRPAGGQVWLITKFAFDLCRARRVDPWDRTACDRWSEIGPERPVQLAGNYAYQAQWPTGKPARGNRRIDPSVEEADADADADTPQTMIVSQP